MLFNKTAYEDSVKYFNDAVQEEFRLPVSSLQTGCYMVQSAIIRKLKKPKLFVYTVVLKQCIDEDA